MPKPKSNFNQFPIQSEFKSHWKCGKWCGLILVRIWLLSIQRVALVLLLQCTHKHGGFLKKKGKFSGSNLTWYVSHKKGKFLGSNLAGFVLGLRIHWSTISTSSPRYPRDGMAGHWTEEQKVATF